VSGTVKPSSTRYIDGCEKSWSRQHRVADSGRCLLCDEAVAAPLVSDVSRVQPAPPPPEVEGKP
jgi:hypothetical protein